MLRDWSIWGGGGYKRGVNFTPPKRGGAKKVLAMLKGDTKCFEVVLTRDLEVLAIVMGGGKMFSPFKRGSAQVLPCLDAKKVFPML